MPLTIARHEHENVALMRVFSETFAKVSAARGAHAPGAVIFVGSAAAKSAHKVAHVFTPLQADPQVLSLRY